MVADGPPIGEIDSITSGYSVPCAKKETDLLSSRAFLKKHQ